MFWCSAKNSAGVFCLSLRAMLCELVPAKFFLLLQAFATNRLQLVVGTVQGTPPKNLGMRWKCCGMCWGPLINSCGHEIRSACVHVCVVRAVCAVWLLLWCCVLRNKESREEQQTLEEKKSYNE